MAGDLRPFAAAAFLGSFLLFTLQLLAAKLLLPRFGGAAYVWTACAAVFQGLLVAGYVYARAALSRWGPAYFRAHLLLLAAPLLWFPLSLGAADGPRPSLRLVSALLTSLGVPIFTLATTAPVVQDWLRRSGRRDAYFLYAASNGGALCALLAYPTLIEPALAVPAQLRAWMILYGAFALLHLKLRPAAAAAAPDARASSSWEERAAWLLLCAGPSAALLASTNLLALDFASVPLLWAAPLAVYLGTFIAVFKRRPWYPRHPSALLIAVVAAWLVAAVVVLFSGEAEGVQAARRLWVLNKVFFYGGGLLVLCLVSHRALAVARPPDAQASDFYVWIAVGGWLGAGVVALILPALARGFPLPELDWAVAGALTLAGLLLSERMLRAQRRLESGPSRGVTLALAMLGALGLGFYVRHSPVLRPGTLAAVRNFYGYYRVGDDGTRRRFHHGNTVHGMQSLDPARAGEPLLYFHRASPAAEALAVLGPRARRVAAFGLGAGALAAYSRLGQRWVFYELDPDVIALARANFTYLEGAEADIAVVAGDARLAFARERPDARFDLIVVDVFSGGAVPVHLLTREALALYLSRLSPTGAILVHVTHRFLDLRGVLGDLARDRGLAGLAKRSSGHPRAGGDEADSSWVVLAPDPRSLASLERSGWTPLAKLARGRRVWTDDYAPLWSAIRL